MSFSVILCTYNPVENVFSKCLSAVSEACKQLNPLEILIIDNNSDVSLIQHEYIISFLNNNPNVKVVYEAEPGLTPARRRGIKESSGEILIFIDDDNFIEKDFFKKGIAIANQNDHIGSWSGQVKLVFEKEPEAWTRKYWGLLVYRVLKQNLWSNFPHMPETMPCGAGLFVRRKVAQHYEYLHISGNRNIQLDRTKNSLFSAGDNDLAACACDIGLGVGLFHELMLYHYIPAKRMTKEYLLKLTYGISASTIVFKSFRGEYPQEPSLRSKVANALRLLLKSPIDRAFYNAVLKGENLGRKILKNNLPNYN